jgi:lambda repressor-like predicted transcriptional regulator
MNAVAIGLLWLYTGRQPTDVSPLHPADIQAAIRKAGQTQAEIARALDVQEAAVSLVVHGRSKSRRVAQEISRVTGIPLTRLWPGAYEDAASTRPVEFPADELARAAIGIAYLDLSPALRRHLLDALADLRIDAERRRFESEMSGDELHALTRARVLLALHACAEIKAGASLRLLAYIVEVPPRPLESMLIDLAGEGLVRQLPHGTWTLNVNLEIKA